MTRHWLSRALLVCRSCVKVGSSICHSCIARASAQVVVVGPSLLYRCSVYWTRGHSSARPSPRIMVASPAALFASRPSDRPSLLCLFVRRLSGTSPSLVRVVDPSLVFLLESSLSYRCLVASPLGSTGHCVRFGSAVQFYTPRGTAVRFYTRLFYCLTRLALRAFLFYLLVAFGRHAVHTHSVPRVVSRHSVITHSLF